MGNAKQLNAAMNAYGINLERLRTETDAAMLAPYEDAVAFLMLISAATETAVVNALSANGVTLTMDYEQVVCDTDTGMCMPNAIPGGKSYEVFVQTTQTLAEPLSGPGDFDGDAVTNARPREDFISVATNNQLDGTEVDGPAPGGCSALSSSHTESRTADALIMIVAIFTALFSGQRANRRSPRIT